MQAVESDDFSKPFEAVTTTHTLGSELCPVLWCLISLRAPEASVSRWACPQRKVRQDRFSVSMDYVFPMRFSPYKI